MVQRLLGVQKCQTFCKGFDTAPRCQASGQVAHGWHEHLVQSQSCRRLRSPSAVAVGFYSCRPLTVGNVSKASKVTRDENNDLLPQPILLNVAKSLRHPGSNSKPPAPRQFCVSNTASPPPCASRGSNATPNLEGVADGMDS